MPKLRPLAVRRLIAMTMVLVGALAFTVRLVDLQVVRAPDYNAEALDKRGVPVTIPSLRGDIVDRNGVVLATTDERYDVQLSPKNVNYWRTLEQADEWVPIGTDEAFEAVAAI